MKRWCVKSMMLSIIFVLVLALVPAVAAQDELGSVMTGTDWLLPCGDYTWNGIPVGVARVYVADRIPPEFTMTHTFYGYSEANGVLSEIEHYVYDTFDDSTGYWWFIVAEDGYTILGNEVFDGGGGLHSAAFVTADCTTGSITIAQGSVYGPKAPDNFVLRSLSCSSPVLDAPGGQPVGDNAVYAGQSWFVNPTPVAGGNYTEIFVSGWKNGFIPTVCIGGAPVVGGE